MRPLVVPFGRHTARRWVDVATVLDAPDKPARSAQPLTPAVQVARCRACRRRVVKSALVDGKGPTCWRRANPATPRARRPRAVGQEGPDLLDELAALDDGCE